MATAQIEEKHIADLTVTEFKALMREMMQETLDQVQGMIWELEQQLPDPDDVLTVRPEIREQLQTFLQDENPHVIATCRET
jgi:hypothetical protein